LTELDKNDPIYFDCQIIAPFKIVNAPPANDFLGVNEIETEYFKFNLMLIRAIYSSSRPEEICFK
jgi:hypothetical protein